MILSALATCLSLVSTLSSVGAAETAAQLWTPKAGACPAGFSLVRHSGVANVNQTLSPGEVEYVRARKTNVLPEAFNAYSSILSESAPNGIELPAYVQSILSGDNGSLPTVGFTVSGGGYRSAMFGAGVMNALDGRNATAVKLGTGGLLQAATYTVGLSGGSWVVYSMAAAGFPTAQELVLGPKNPVPGGYGGWSAAKFGALNVGLGFNGSTAAENVLLEQLVTEISGKHAAGYPVTGVDILARVLARHFLNGTTEANYLDNVTSVHGAGQTFSELVNVPAFVSHEMPFPIILADSWSAAPGVAGDQIPQTNALYEFNAFEVGSFDPMLAAFTPVKFLGSRNESVCITGFDQADFMIASSSDFLVQFNSSNVTAEIEGAAGFWVNLVNTSFPEQTNRLDVSLVPNSFFGMGNGSWIDAQEDFVGFVDGGEDGEGVPFQPLLVPARGVEVIIVADANGEDSENWSHGGTIVGSALRTTLFPSDYAFPLVPTNTTIFDAQNLTMRPVFFGCNSSLTAAGSSLSTPPLIVYIANGGPARGQPAVTNNTEDTTAEPMFQSLMAQTFNIATQGFPANASQLTDPEWPVCLGCAVVDRAREKAGIARTGICSSCFDRYCWNETLANSQGPSTFTVPPTATMVPPTTTATSPSSSATSPASSSTSAASGARASAPPVGSSLTAILSFAAAVICLL